MTISNTESRKTYAGNGATTSFSTSPVIFYDTSDLVVYVTTDATGVSTTLVENTTYTVTGGDGAVGTVNLAGGSAPYGAPATGTTLVIQREVPATQAADFVNNDDSDAEVVETAFDRLTVICQQIANRLLRAFRLSDSDVTGASTDIDTPTAGQFLRWKTPVTDGIESAAITASGSIGIPVSIAEGGTGGVTAAAARTALDVQQDVFTTRGDLVRGGVSGVAERVALGTNLQVLSSDGTDAVWATRQATDTERGFVELATQAEVEAMTDTARVLTPNHTKIVIAAEQATTSGSSKDFSVPAGVRRITIMIEGVSTNGTGVLAVQIGDAGGIETSGYVSGSSSNNVATSSTGSYVFINNVQAANNYTGVMTLELKDVAGFTWMSGSVGIRDDGLPSHGSGVKSLTAELTQVRFLTADTFDLGSVSVSYER